jgi:hypothetical protein
VTAVLGGISAIVLVIYLISPPGVPTIGPALELELDRKLGIWLGLISTVAVAVGGYMAMREEGASFGDAADRLSGSAAAPPPSQPPPPPPPPSGS